MEGRRHKRPGQRLDRTGPGRHSRRVTEDWARLGSYVASRRSELGYPTTRAFANALAGTPAPISEKTLGRLESGKSVSRNTLTVVEAALDWSPGSARAILAGGVPTLQAVDDRESALAQAEILAMTPEQRAKTYMQIKRVLGDQAAEEWSQRVIAMQAQADAMKPPSPQQTRREVG